MPRSTNPHVLVFDVNETLLDITALEPLFARCFGEARAMREWFAQLVLYSQSMTLAGLYTPFGTLARGAFFMQAKIAGVEVTEADADELGQRIATMPAHADAAPALERLRAAGFRLVTLTNSPPGPSPSPLEKAGLAKFFEESFSVAAVKRFKPAPETYAHVARACGVELGQTCLVACHLWDTLGAQAAGAKGALVTRPGNAVLPAEGLPAPDLVAPDMGALAEKMIAAWR